MTGYVRQSAADIVPTGVVRAAPINNELNALRDAFSSTGGHKHDGTAAEGHPVPLIGDSDMLNKIATDTSNNRHGVFVEVGGAAVEQVRFQDGAIVPVTDNDVDLGTSSNEFKNLFITGTANIDSLVADTADINGGTVDGAVIGGSSAAAGSFTTIGASGVVTSTVSTGTAPLVIASTTKVSNLNVDQLDGADWAAPAAIGTSTPAAGTFTSLTANTSLVAATADINGGTLDGAVIGASSAQAITGTTVTATTGFVGGLTGAVTGNVTGNLTGNVTGDVTGNLTGNVTASSGSSTFNDVVINGGLNMNAGTSATITNLTSPTNTNDAATKGYVDTSIANLIDSAPGALDTLNELAAALGDDASFSTTVTNSIATKLALAGGTMSGAIAMGTNKITGLGNPTANQDAATKTYVDTADALKLSLTGGTMSGAIAMGTSKITGLGDPTANQDAATKIYVDGILGSATSAAASAAAAAVSASNAATSASNASTSASNAATSASSASTSATNAAASYDAFDDRYLGSKTSAPSVDNDGNALLTGALYWNSTSNELYLWTGSAWTRSALSGTDYVAKSGDTMTGALTTTALTLSDGTANGVAYLNGSKVLTSGSALTFSGAELLNSQNSNGGTYIVNRNVSTGTASTAYMISDATAAFTGYTAMGSRSSGYTTSGMLEASSGGLFSVGLSNGLNIMTLDGYPVKFGVGNTEQMRLTSTGLGIGTSSPLGKLHSSSSSSGATPSGNANQLIAESSGNAGLTIATGASSLGNIFFADSGDAADGYVQYDQSGRSMRFGTATAERARIDASGNLGLGVTPSAWSVGKAVEVGQIGNALFGATASQLNLMQNATYNGGFKYANTGAASYYQQLAGSHNWQVAPSGTAGTAISFTQAMTLDASGNLGVGTTAPVQAISIGGLGATANTFKSMSFQSGSTEVNYVRSVVQDGSNYALTFGTYATGIAERMRITAAGNLAIGATTASNKLEVNGSARFYTAANGDVSITHSGLVSSITAAGSVSLAFGTNNTEKARISTAGGFSVGTTADPGAGAIYATGNITAYYSSDIKFKENVRDIPDALATVNAIGGKLFDWTDDYIESKGGADGYFVQKADFGVVAQDVQKVFPIAVRTRDDGSLAVDYEKLGALAFAALVELTKRVEALEAK